MALLYAPRPFRKQDKQEAIQHVVAGTVPDRDFYLLLLGAMLLAVCGIFTDSIPVLIASMIVAPLASPILALGLGTVIGYPRLIARSIGLLAISCVIAMAGSALITTAFGDVRVDPVFISFGSRLPIAFIIALLAGVIAAYGQVRTRVGQAFTGIGIAVSLMPPLVASGIALASSDMPLFRQTIIIFLLNVLGIWIASAMTFAFFGLRSAYEQMPHNDLDI
jgi:uncharacterized hydrophobic protein (TIGR00271 family)